jgi:hypothetical protein
MTEERTCDAGGWHADDQQLRMLVDGRASAVFAASLEMHVIGCDDCRGRMNTMSYTDELEPIWAGIREAVERPGPTPAERLLGVLGLSPESVQLLTAVPALRLGWLLGVAVAVSFAGLATVAAVDLGLTLFLLVAPLVPVAGVAAAFGGDADPSHEAVVATPYSAPRLLALRTTAVLVTSAPVAVVVALVLPAPAWLALAWLTPAAAGIAITLALAPTFGFTAPAVAAGTTWGLVCLAAGRAQEPMALVGPASQSICLALVVVCGAVLLSRSGSFDMPRRLS